MNPLNEQDEAIKAATTPSELRACSTDQLATLRTYLLSDSYAFAKVVCGHADLIAPFHAPLSYVLCGLTDKLIWTLNDPSFDGYVTRAIRKELWRRGINWKAPEGRMALDALLDFVNVRVYRGSFKSSIGTHAGALFEATKDPNETAWIVSSTDENAWSFCEQIGETIEKNDAYRSIFWDRLPPNPKEFVTQRRITLAGRTISHPQACIEADGYQTRRVSAHFSISWIDDLVIGGPGGNNTPAGIKSAKTWLTNVPGFEMATKRIKRRHLGTIWDEDDDNRFLTSGALAKACFTLNIPIEVYEGGYVDNILVRGKPTNATLHPVAKIQVLQDKILADPQEGAISWRCNYLLDATAGDARLFPHAIVHDPERQYTKIDHPDKDLTLKGRFLITRLLRNATGQKIEIPGYSGDPDLPQRWKWVKAFDPLRDLDRVITLDPAWSDGPNADNWAASCTGDDSDAVRYQLETQSGEDGVEGWIEALVDMVAFWRPRLVGFDKSAQQDAAVKKIIATDKRLRRIRHLFVGIPTHNKAKKVRIRNFVAEPLKMWKLLLDPDDAITKDEMTDYKGSANGKDGILDSLAMAPAIHVSQSSSEQRRERALKLRLRAQRLDRAIDPYTGVPYAA